MSDDFWGWSLHLEWITGLMTFPLKDGVCASYPRVRSPHLHLFAFMWRLLYQCHIKSLTAVLIFFFFALATVATAWQQLVCKYLNWFYEGLWICEHCSEALKYANTVLYPSTCCNKGWCWTGFFPFIYTLFCPDSLLYSQINFIKSCCLFF